ncbi:MAG: cardiolipin synthase, partial [Clostridiales bacterium]|nr:cardiolipin synthase [Clostridiales bacterium]
MDSDMLSGFLEMLYIVNILFSVLIIFYERKNSSETLAWILVLFFIPYFGFFLYLAIGFDGRKHLVFSDKNKSDEWLFNEYLKLSFYSNDESSSENQISRLSMRNILNIPGTEKLNDLIYLNYISGDGILTTNNEIDVYFDGNKKFEQLLGDIASANEFIHMEYYILRNDGLGRQIISALALAAARGVEVKLIIDGMGCNFTPKRIFKPLIKAGGKLGIFLPPFLARINYRDHRKLCVIDGKKGYIGGFNIGDEYLGKVKRFGNWKDTHIRIKGSAVSQLELRFIMDWNFCSDDKLTLSIRYFKQHAPLKTGMKMQIISSGPDTTWANIKYSYFKMINEAEKSIYIETPYFVPDESILEALRIQSLAGIDVRIIIPGNPDHFFVYGASLSYLGQLLGAGVKCYQYKNGFIHSKLLMVDGLITSVGTANMDIRSFELN